MPKPISFTEMNAKTVASMEEAPGVPEPETPFRILIMGDFSGRANRGIFQPGDAVFEKSLHPVDRDNLDGLMARLGVEIRLPLAGEDNSPVVMRFTELDDFHPDRLFGRLEVFKAIKETRKKISDPSYFARAAGELRDQEKAPASATAPGETDQTLKRLSGQTTGSLLDQVLEETQGEGPKSEWERPPSEWDSFLKRIVQPHLVPDMEQKQSQILAVMDAATGELMRAILHYPDFQAIEAAWRGLHFLVSRIETGDELRLVLLDISKAELAAALGSAEDLRSTAIYRLLVEQTVETPGGEPWATLAGNYSFDQTGEDAKLLGCMANIARAAGAHFVAAAGDRLLGCESLAQTPDPRTWKQTAAIEGWLAWEALRKLPEASHIGLALPRFLLRLPYGAETDPVEHFDFEEMEARPDHDHYLWGNACFACVCLLAQAFSEYGWDFRPGIIQDLEGLPLHVYKEEGEAKIKPCAEVVLTELAAEAILEKGLMPLLSFKNQDRVRLARFQSLADPSTAN